MALLTYIIASIARPRNVCRINSTLPHRPWN